MLDQIITQSTMKRKHNHCITNKREIKIIGIETNLPQRRDGAPVDLDTVDTDVDCDS